MALKIRLRQQGRKNRLFYRLVVTDSRTPRDGGYKEAIGWYNPHESAEDKVLLLQEDRLHHWINCGAELTEKAEALVAKGAPAVVKRLKENQVAKRKKLAEKRRARKSATKA